VQNELIFASLDTLVLFSFTIMENLFKKIALFKEEIDAWTPKDGDIETFKKRFLGRKSVLQDLFQALHTLEPSERKETGKALNGLKVLAEAKCTSCQTEGHSQGASLEEDLTLPPPRRSQGSLHLLTLVKERVISILEKIGFKVVEGPEIEDEWHNFSALNFPPNHPARDMQDTFFVEGDEGEERMALRTQTSSIQIRMMEKYPPPIRILSVGRVFRNETISARSHCMFHQIEGLYVDKGVSFADLRTLLYHFVQEFFGKEVNVRLRPSYFPFTEPSAEVDITCLLCKGDGCRLCKKAGWVEIGGAGLVDPQVLTNCHVDTETYTGYAFGIGIERIAMLLAQVPDLRLFTENDVRFLRQYSYVTIE
jgi:phenylalanyl-tRNA synthetase alpha chain